uniref:Uncharacterized protein n=2 Tax=Hemiselmis tepida TaxID=464990 RepID=A0A7S0W8S3_9CRYP|mmetsp:Transcript_36373/g.92885  ORF Transcript_36373/g.92885 Transcript_36373/m.92885 type:complete len:203 (+) Transcript_36373:263-871(+)
MRTPVHLAAVFGWGETNPSTLTELYAAGANFNAGDQADNTPLHLAASEGWTETCKQLVEYGARIDPVNRWAQQTPLGSAVANGHTETAAALRLLGSANETVSHLESELTKCTWDNQKHCTNATLDCWNDGAPEGAAPGECTVHCDSPPCEAKCVGDESNTAIPGGNWGCHLNNFFPGPQPILDPFPPKPSGIRGVIQGTTVS